jgi:hypothetical protein
MACPPLLRLALPHLYMQYSGGAVYEISIFIVEINLLKILTFLEIIRIILNRSAVQI